MEDGKIQDTPYIKRPDGYQGTNAAWMCAHCLFIGDVDAAFQPHESDKVKCSGGHAIALVIKK